MPLKLRVHTPFPPGEFPYRQTQGINQLFAGDGFSIVQQGQRVREFRVANKLDRASLEECVSDIDAYTCARLNNDPAFVVDTDAPVAFETAPRGGCATCGNPQ